MEIIRFREYMQTHMKKDWEQEYIDYVGIKKLIGEIRVVIYDENCVEKEIELDENNNSIITPPLSNDVLPDRLDHLYIRHNGKHLKKFISSMDAEIHKVYLFYTKMEKELYVKINSELHKRNSGETSLELKDLRLNLENLISIATMNEEVLKFVDLNVTAVKKLVSKFDKNFSTYFRDISKKFFYERLQGHNTDLCYLVEFKIIDEVSALLEDLNGYFHRSISKINRPKKRVMEINGNQPLIDSTESRDSNKNTVQYCNDLMDELNERIIRIDEESLNFFKKLKFWNVIVKHEIRVIYNHFSNNKMSQFNTQIEKNKQNPALREYSESNSYNIELCLVHTAFYYLLYFSVFPTILHLCQNYNDREIYSGLVLGSCHIGELLGLLIFSFFTKRNIFKGSLIVSSLLFMVSQFLYAFSYHYKSVIMLSISRFILGLGHAKVINRKYLTDYVNKLDVIRYSCTYNYLSFTGAMVGILLTLAFLFFSSDFDMLGHLHFNEMTNTAWIGLVLSFFMLLLIIVFFTDPKSIYFSIYEGDAMSSSQSMNLGSQATSRKVSRVYSKKKQKEEHKMVSEIEKKLEYANNQFSDTNLVVKNIEKIKSNESTNCTDNYKCFLVLTFLIMLCKLWLEASLLITPFYMEVRYDLVLKVVTPIILAPYVLVFPCYQILQNLLLKYNERRVILIELAIYLLSSLLMINYFYDNIYQYSIGYTFTTVLALLIKSTSFDFLVKVSFPNIHSTGYISTRIFGFNILTTLAKITGSSLIFVMGINLEWGKVNLVSITCLSGCIALLLISFVVFYSEIRIKAISRIARKKSAL